MAQLFFYYGTMNSGKTLQLLSVAHNYEEQGKKVVIFTSSLDTRSGKNKVKSRIGVEHMAFSLSKNDNIYSKVKYHTDNIDCILVDEAQFLTTKQVTQLVDIVGVLEIPVICYGLKNDYTANLFEGSKALLVWADKIQEIKTVCELCGRKATQNLLLSSEGRVILDGNTVIIGDTQYHSLCRMHYINITSTSKAIRDSDYICKELMKGK